MGSKAPTHPPKNGHANGRPPIPPPPPPRRGNTTSSNIAKADAAISRLSFDRDFVNINRFVVVIPPGTAVALGPKQEIEGTVLETNIKEGGYVFYRVAWWDGNSRKTEWLEAHEVCRPAEKMTVSIGFGAAQ